MADTKDHNEDQDQNRIAPRSVDPEHRDKIGGGASPSKSDDRGRSIRREPVVEEADGGDISGVAGGGIDGNVSGLGGDRNRR